MLTAPRVLAEPEPVGLTGYRCRSAETPLPSPAHLHSAVISAAVPQTRAQALKSSDWCRVRRLQAWLTALLAGT